ncbi:MAG: hypothetical protein AB7S99_08800 [Pseudodonghicola sp.]
MNRVRKEKLEKALKDYTDKVTQSAEAAKAALVEEGIYQQDGTLAPGYREPAAAA